MKSFNSSLRIVRYFSCFLMLVLSGVSWAKDVTSDTIETTAVHGDIFVDTGGTRYVYQSPYSTGTNLKVAPGMRILFVADDPALVDGYTYSGPIVPGSTYAATYLADGAASGAFRSAAIIAARETSTMMGFIQNRAASVLFDSAPSGTLVAFGNGKSYYDTNDSKAESGLSAGSFDDAKYGAWFQGAYSRIKDDDEATKFRANLWNITVGFDVTMDKNLLLGVSYTYGNISDGKTDYNQGTLDQNSHTISPYIAYRIDDMFSVDAMFGYGHVSKEITRTQSYVVGNTTIFDVGLPKVKGETDTKRIFFGISGNARYQPHSDWMTNLRVGYSYLRDKQDAYTEETTAVYRDGFSNKIGRFSLSGEVEYVYEDFVRPFAKAGVNHDSTLTKVTYSDGPQPKNDKTGLHVGGGVKFTQENLSGVLELNHDFGQGKLTVTTISAKIRYAF